MRIGVRIQVINHLVYITVGRETLYWLLQFIQEYVITTLLWVITKLLFRAHEWCEQMLCSKNQGRNISELVIYSLGW